MQKKNEKEMTKEMTKDEMVLKCCEQFAKFINENVDGNEEKFIVSFTIINHLLRMAIASSYQTGNAEKVKDFFRQSIETEYVEN